MKALNDLDPNIDKVDHLIDVYPAEVLSKTAFLAKEVKQEEAKSSWEVFVNPMRGDNTHKTIFDGSKFLPSEAFVTNDQFVTV